MCCSASGDDVFCADDAATMCRLGDLLKPAASLSIDGRGAECIEHCMMKSTPSDGVADAAHPYLRTRAGAAALCAALSEHRDDTKTAQVFT